MDTTLTAPQTERLSWRNTFMFSLGTIGRDFVYNLFNTYLLTYILFTKTLTDAQFASVSIIIVVARLFDAFNDPIMGGIVENTRTRWGKFKPWILAGVLLTGAVVVGAFSTGLQGWNFIAYLAFIYLAFSITFTMNDISYWGMMPSLSSNEADRSRLTTVAQLCASVGGGLVGVIVPVFTTGQWAIGGNAVTAFRWVSVLSVVLMIGFQMLTIVGVKEKPLPPVLQKAPRMTPKDMFKTIFKNDQLLWAALIMLLFNIGTNVVNGGLSMSYIYFEFGYNGILTTIFGVLYAVFSTLFTFLYPWLSKKFGRTKLMIAATVSLVFGYVFMFVFGASVPADTQTNYIVKFALLTIGNGFVGFGQSAFYMITLICIANTVEYNEWKTGKREEGLIFSVRPFTAKMGSALMQLLVMLVYLIVGVTRFTNQISDLENDAARGLITDAERTAGIEAVIRSVPQARKIALLACMCFIPIVFVGVAIFLYLKKFKINEKFYQEMLDDIAKRNSQEVSANEAE